jgi:GT2 family glycosyltransferase
MYVEDLDLCWRLAQAGWRRRLEADITVMHVGNASGIQAWGEARATRWMAESYAWYAETLGTAAARRWATVNVAAIVAHLAGCMPGALLGSSWRRDRIRQLVGVLSVNARALVDPKSVRLQTP